MLANVKELCIISELGKATNFLASSNQNELEVRMTDLPNTKLIPLTQGKFAIVDAEDYDWLMQWKWCYNNGYALRGKHNPVNKKTEIELMHRFLLNPKKNELVDHINNNKLDNRKCNLRIADKRTNAINSKINKKNTSGFKGIWLTPQKNWRAETRYMGKK